VGTAARFDAATDRISWTGGTAAPDTTTGVAFTCWVHLSVDRDDFSTILRLWSSSNGTRLTFATSSGGTVPALFSPGNTSGVVSTTAMTVGNWFAYGFSVTGTSGSIYGADAALSSPTQVSGTVSGGSTAQGFTLGGRDTGDATEWLNGRIKYPRLWSATMTLSEAQTEWASTTPVRTSNLWGAWVVSGPGDLADVSGNGRNLTAGSTAVTAEAGPPIDPPDFAKGAAFMNFFA
jgi:hypothetical protein